MAVLLGLGEGMKSSVFFSTRILSRMVLAVALHGPYPGLLHASRHEDEITAQKEARSHCKDTQQDHGCRQWKLPRPEIGESQVIALPGLLDVAGDVNGDRGGEKERNEEEGRIEVTVKLDKDREDRY